MWSLTFSINIDLKLGLIHLLVHNLFTQFLMTKHRLECEKFEITYFSWFLTKTLPMIKNEMDVEQTFPNKVASTSLFGKNVLQSSP